MAIEKRFYDLRDAVICTLALILFSFFIHSEFPVKIISFAALIPAAYIFSLHLNSVAEIRRFVGKPSSLLSIQIFSIAGFTIGILLAMFYRWYLGLSLLPLDTIHSFVIVAAMIGASEEIVFRGIIQELTSGVGISFSVLFSSVAHTAYKCALFATTAAVAGIDIGFLAIWTLGAGIVFGTIRYFSKSVMPSVLAHVIFDIFVYAEYVNAPWWVW
jgi:membrane protease YdiL (CAAX protease family)